MVGMLDGIFIVVYMLAMVCVGLYFKTNDSMADYAVADKKLGMSVLTATLLATAIGGGAMTGSVGNAYSFGLLEVPKNFVLLFINLFMALVVAKPMSDIGGFTAPEMLGRVYGKKCQALGGLFCALYMIGTGPAMQSIALGSCIHLLLGIDMKTGMILGMAIILAYTLFSGMWGVAMTDYVQFIFLAVGILIATVMDYPFDIGIATDGDADRLGVIDDTGRYLKPNDILVLLYYYLVKYKKWEGPVVRNVSTTHMLDRVAEKFGQKCYEVPVGFKYISAKMTEVNAILGGESSGGLTVRGHINGKDGIYAAMMLVEMIAVTGRKLSQIYADIEKECGKIYMEERSYRFSQAKKEDLNRILFEEKKIPELPFDIEKVDYMDGSKVYFKNGGWVSGRFSGTEPLIRIFCEMPEKEDAVKICEIYEKFLGLEA